MRPSCKLQIVIDSSQFNEFGSWIDGGSILYVVSHLLNIQGGDSFRYCQDARNMLWNGDLINSQIRIWRDD